MNTIGSRLRYLRKKQHLTMKELHSLTGLSTGNISDMENDKYMPSVSSLIPLSKALHCSIDWLLLGDNEVQISEHSEASDSTASFSKCELDLIRMIRTLDERDRSTVSNFVEMLYLQSAHKKGSTYSIYTNEGERLEKNDDSTNSSIA